jgi:phenylalanyl-tRNA synthetase beta chain
MKFTLSWLKDHLDTSADVNAVAAAMTAAGLEVEHVSDAAARLAPFSVAKIVEAVQHPNADRLRVCQVETKDGLKEIVCGAPNARAGLVTIYAPIGAYVPGLGVTLVEKPVRGVVSNGMLCSASELELAEESEGILELDPNLAVATPAAEVFGAEPVIDFEVTPNRPDWLGVAGIARDLAAAGLGKLTTPPVAPVAGKFKSPVTIRIDAPKACPAFAGRYIRGVRNGPSPAWLQARLKAVGLRPINALVDVTNLLSLDRCRPLHVYDAKLLVGETIVARLGHHSPHGDEQLIALDGKTYDIGPEMCVIADADGERPVGLGGVMGGTSTGCSDETVDVFVESAWFDPIRTAETGRRLSLTSDAQYRFARGVDPGFVIPGLERATKLILELCGGEPSEVVFAGELPAAPAPVAFDPAYVRQLSGLDVPEAKIVAILQDLGFTVAGSAPNLTVTPPTWRRDVEGKADLVEEVARIVGFAALPSTPLPDVARPAGGVLTPRQARVRTARRALAALGYAETVGWSFTSRANAELFGGGSDELMLANPIASELDCMRPSALPGLIEAAGRNKKRGFADAALFEIGPVFDNDRPEGQRTTVAAVVAHNPARDWQGKGTEPLFALKGDLMALLDDLGAPTGSLQLDQTPPGSWWRPGRSAGLKLGNKLVAAFGQLHPRVLKALDVEDPIIAFELWLEAIPEPKKKPTKNRPGLNLSPLMPLSRDFAFLVPRDKPAGDLVRAVTGADKALIASARVFDVYEGTGVPEGFKSVAVEAIVQPRDKTLTEAEIEQLSAKIVAAAEKAGAKLRS